MPNDHLRIELSRCRHERQVNGHDREGGRIDSEYVAGHLNYGGLIRPKDLAGWTDVHQRLFLSPFAVYQRLTHSHFPTIELTGSTA